MSAAPNSVSIINPPVGDLNPSGASANVAATIGKNTVFGLVANLVQMGTRFITVPIVIGHLGLDGYGIWSIIMAVAGYMRFGSAGVKSAFQKYVAEATASRNFLRANNLLSTGTALMLVVSIVGLAPIAFLSHDLTKVIGVPVEFADSTAQAIVLLAFVMMLSNTGAAYEAIVMGGHRIDLARKYNTVFTVLEAIAIIFVLREGYGLVAMTAIMMISELGYLLCCYFSSKRILPEITMAPTYMSQVVMRELVTFAGSYQLVGVLEMLNSVLLSVAILKLYGAEAAGLFAIAGKVVMVALLPHESFIIPVLSSGSAIYAEGSRERIQSLLRNSFKATAVLAMLPLGFIAIHGGLVVFAWTGVKDANIQKILWLMCLGGFFSSISRLSFILYRASGHMWMDNLRQLFLILALLLILAFGSGVGVLGALVVLAAAQFISMIFMLFALYKAFHGFAVGEMLWDLGKLVLVTIMMVSMGMIAIAALQPWGASERLFTVLELGVVFVVSVTAALAALLMTGSLTRAEIRVVFNAFTRKANFA